MSFVQVRERSGSGLSSGTTDRTPFYGIRIPDEVNAMLKALKGKDAETIKKILKLVIQSLEDGTLTDNGLGSLTNDKLTEETVRVLFAGLRSLLTSAIRHPNLKSEMFKEDLIQLKLSGDLITDLSTVIYGKRSGRLLNAVRNKRVRLPQLDSFKWRVDVTISNSTLNRVLEPSILMEMTLSDGSIKTFEVPVSKFHELRYNVAFVLKEMEDLEKRKLPD